ncbi:MAG: spore germination protein [Candidatus Carbobacillus altaicus]|nr:spore germination protein [Candidatus Carbobacillus altaicus]
MQAKEDARHPSGDPRLLACKDRLKSAEDLVYQVFERGFSEDEAENGPALTRVEVLYLKTIADENKVMRLFVRPFYEADPKTYKAYLEALPIQTPYQDEKQAVDQLLNGSALVIYGELARLYDVRLALDIGIQPAEVESVIQGPQNALSENLLVNINLLRFRYRVSDLVVKLTELGSQSHTNVAIVYQKSTLRENVLTALQQKLEDGSLEALFAAGQLERYFNGNKWTLFPTFMITDRPDRIIYELNRGKVALIIDGSQFALIAPAYFFDFYSAMDDLYHPTWVRVFFLTMRFTALIVTLITPALYVALTSFNPGVFRAQLTLSIAGSRAAVPFSAFFEVLFMMIVVELILEASIRLPKSISAAATTVGGLILGQATTAAGLVSDIMLIVVATVAISSFVVPINSMLYAVRIMRYPILFASAGFGLVGLGVALVGLIFYLASLDSFGEPYFYLPFSKGNVSKTQGGA